MKSLVQSHICCNKLFHNINDYKFQFNNWWIWSTTKIDNQCTIKDEKHAQTPKGINVTVTKLLIHPIEIKELAYNIGKWDSKN
jgi:hypothetical protein